MQMQVQMLKMIQTLFTICPYEKMKPDLLYVVATPLLAQLRVLKEDGSLKNQLLRTCGQAAATVHGQQVVPSFCESVVSGELLSSELGVESALFGLQKAAVQASEVLKHTQLWAYIGCVVREGLVKEAKGRAQLVRFFVEWTEQMKG